MRLTSAQLTGPTTKRRTSEQASARVIILVLIFFLLGAAVSAYWFYRAANRGTANDGGETNSTPLIVLSDGTKAVLKRLDSPVDIRFYSLLDPSSVSESVQAFAGRVDQLLAGFEQEAGGKINVIRYNSRADMNATAAAAAADGIPLFNRDKGDACYFGIAVAHQGKKESLSQLAPEWEPALEVDITRAIARLVDATQPPSVSVVISQSNTSAVQEVKAVIPNVAAVSAEEGTRLLRQSSFKEMQEAIQQMDLKVAEAEQQLVAAQNGKSETEQQAALKHLQEVHAERMQQIKDIAARSQAQIDVFQRLKAAPQ